MHRVSARERERPEGGRGQHVECCVSRTRRRGGSGIKKCSRRTCSLRTCSCEPVKARDGLTHGRARCAVGERASGFGREALSERQDLRHFGGEFGKAAQSGAVVFARRQGSRQQGVCVRFVGEDSPLQVRQVDQCPCVLRAPLQRRLPCREYLSILRTSDCVPRAQETKLLEPCGVCGNKEACSCAHSPRGIAQLMQLHELRLPARLLTRLPARLPPSEEGLRCRAGARAIERADLIHDRKSAPDTCGGQRRAGQSSCASGARRPRAPGGTQGSRGGRAAAGAKPSCSPAALPAAASHNCTAHSPTSELFAQGL